MKAFKLLFLFSILFFSMFSAFAGDEECSQLETECQVESIGFKFDLSMQKASDEFATNLLTGDHSLLRNNYFNSDDGFFLTWAKNLDDTVKRIIKIAFYAMYLFVTVLFITSLTSPARRELAMDWAGRFGMALFVFIFSAMLFSMAMAISIGFNGLIADQTGMNEFFAPSSYIQDNDGNDIPNPDAGFSSGIIRAFLLLFMGLLGVFILLTKIGEIMLLPLFTLFLFFWAIKKDNWSSLIGKIVAFTMLSPAIIFFVLFILKAIVIMTFTGLFSQIIGAILSTVALVIFLFFFGVEIIVSFFMGSMVRMLAGSIAGSIGKALSTKLK